MLTFFTTAKPFRGHDGIIQRNALRSWTLLHPDADVILFGDDEGAAQVSEELRLRHEPRVQRNEFGTKRLDSLFCRAQTIARYDLLCYINCDIVLMGDFWEAVKRVRTQHRPFLMAGRRWDVAIAGPMNFDSQDWEAQLREHVLREGRRRGPEWIDYFVFTRGLYGAELPSFVVGRVFWDNWLVWKALDSNYPVIDASASVLAVHQNHDYGYHPQGKQGVFYGTEARHNYELAGGWKHLRTIADATDVLRKDGVKPNRLRHWSAAKHYLQRVGQILFHGGIEQGWFVLLNLTRPIRRKLGLDAETFKRWRRKPLAILGKHS